MSAVRNSSLNYGSASSKSAFDGFIDKVNSQNLNFNEVPHRN